MLPSNGNWVQEALANAVQVRLYPDALKPGMIDKFARQYEAGEKSLFWPLEELLTTKSITTKRYIQLLSFMDFLVDEHEEALPAFWKKLLALTTPVRKGTLPALLEVTESDAEALEEAYLAWAMAGDPPR